MAAGFVPLAAVRAEGVDLFGFAPPAASTGKVMHKEMINAELIVDRTIILASFRVGDER